MLSELQIENIGIIDKLDLTFDSGLNVLTGETGAGKSIIITAFSMLLGERVKPAEIIRFGFETAKITGLFNLPSQSNPVIYLINTSIPVSEGEILVQREISLNGRNKCYINGQLVNVSILKDLGDLLVDIHGTHDHQKILNKSTHINYIDRFADISKELNKYNDLYLNYKTKKSELSNILNTLSLQKEKEDFLKFQIQELEYLEDFKMTEEELDLEHSMLADSSKIKDICEDALNLGINSDDSILSKLKNFKNLIKELVYVDSEFNDLLVELESAGITVNDSCNKISDLNFKVNPDPSRLDELDLLISSFKKHKLKYGVDFENLKKLYLSLKEQLNIINNPSDTIKLQSEIQLIENDLKDLSNIISAKRKKTAKILEKKFEIELKDLGMSYSKVIINFEKINLSQTGIDDIEFLLITNPGETAKPLIKIASGGELCRIMLAFKSILSSIDDIPILVFDEIDANIGGVTSVAAALKMVNIAISRQVITITHQPQIASKARKHFAVSKIQTKDKTKTNVKFLNFEERIDEISRMLGGTQITSVVREHARQMIAPESPLF